MVGSSAPVSGTLSRRCFHLSLFEVKASRKAGRSLPDPVRHVCPQQAVGRVDLERVQNIKYWNIFGWYKRLYVRYRSKLKVFYVYIYLFLISLCIGRHLNQFIKKNKLFSPVCYNFICLILNAKMISLVFNVDLKFQELLTFQSPPSSTLVF